MSKQRDKGTKWQKRIEDYLADQGIKARRQALHGTNDRGDLHVGPLESPVVIEAKNQSRHSLGEWLDEATTETANADGQAGLVWFHRRGKGSPGEGYVLMDGATAAYLLREAGLA